MDGKTGRNQRMTVTASSERSRLEPELLAKAYALIVSQNDLSHLKGDRNQGGNGAEILKEEERT